MTTHPPSTHLPLQRLTRSEAQARSALAQRARACTFTWGEQEWKVTLAPVADLGEVRGESATWRVQAQWAGAAFELRVPGQAAQAWIATRFPDLELPGLPDELLAAALESACGQLLATLTALQRGPASIVAIQREAVPAVGGPAHAFSVEARCGGQGLCVWLATDSLGLMIMAGLVASLPPVRNKIPAQDLPLLLRAEVGCTWLPAAQLAELRVGDSVLLEHAFLTPEGEIWLGQDDWGVRVRHVDTQFTVVQAFTQLGLTMSSNPTPPLGDQFTAADKIPMRLAFDLGERTMTLGDLQNLQVGQSIDLARPLSSTVSLRVNGALVGVGELIEIDGRLGVTITSMASESGK